MDDPYQAALDQLAAAGLLVETLEASGKLVRCRVEGDKGGKRSGWYVLHEFTGRTGRRLLAGRFGNWKDPGCPESGWKVDIAGGGLDEAERREYEQRQREARRRAAEEKQARAAEAAERANRIWPKLPEAGSSAYLQRKRVGAFGLRFSRGSVVVPVRVSSMDGALVGLQFIRADGSKKFLTGTPKQGACHVVGELGAHQKRLAIAEGYATAATVHLATGWPVVVAFDAGNLEPVAKAWREQFPDARMVIFGDDDHEKPGNPGRAKAEQAARAVTARVALPKFVTPAGRTDWNDLHLEQGLDAVKNQVRECLKAPRADSPAPSEGNGEAKSDDPLFFDLDVLLEHYVLVYGSETVFDERSMMIVTLGALRAAAGRQTVRAWLEHPRRRIVSSEGMVFDPTGSAPPGSINLFRGFNRQPRPGKCDGLLRLLFHLCGESDNLFNWVLKWTAFPLQHPGAKMRTAIIMHGGEGTGKNTWWGAVRDIYGEYGGIITQQELESQFTGWASRKLFIIGNEVVSRQEMYHQSGRLRNMITEPEWMINEKHLPSRQEANHCNFVFLANAHQPATPNPDDRRYLVIWTPPPLADHEFAAIDAELRGGGVEALYDYLLQLPLEDFNEHSKPPMTAAKQDLIEASMDSHERFFRQWRSGDLPIAYRPCLSLDAYRAYRRWCDERGERAPAREAVFLSAMGKRMRKAVKLFLEGTKQRQKTFLLPEEQDLGDQARRAPDVSESRWLGEQVSFFRGELEDWNAQ